MVAAWGKHAMRRLHRPVQDVCASLVAAPQDGPLHS